MKRFLRFLPALLAVLAMTGPAQTWAQDVSQISDDGSSTKLTCSAADPGDIYQNFCYDSMFPVRLMGTDDIPGPDVPAPPGAATYDFAPTGCYCLDCVPVCIEVPGYLMGGWIPIQIVEATRAPGCVVMMDGLDLGKSASSVLTRSGGETHRNANGNITGGFRNFTMYDFPLAQSFASMLGMGACAATGPSYETVMSSMMLPWWNRLDLANLLFPEALAFATPFATLTGPLECAADTTGIGVGFADSAFWSMGCWGRTYPLMGAYGAQGQVTGSSLIVARAMYTMGAIARYSGGIFSKYGITTVGNGVANGACTPLPAPYLQKSEFKLTQMFPVPESGIGSGTVADANGDSTSFSPLGALATTCAHRVGASEYSWGPFRKTAVKGEDEAYLVWRWVDCCEMNR